jgi:hypothetical protein
LIVDSDVVFCNEYKPYLSKKDFYAPISGDLVRTEQARKDHRSGKPPPKDGWYQPVELHMPYFGATQRILKLNPVPYTFVSHQMLFNKFMCSDMLDYIENIHNKYWCDAIVANLDFNENSNMSEWDLYANYCLHKEPEKCEINTDLKWKHDCNDGIPDDQQKKEIIYYTNHNR